MLPGLLASSRSLDEARPTPSSPSLDEARSTACYPPLGEAQPTLLKTMPTVGAYFRTIENITASW